MKKAAKKMSIKDDNQFSDLIKMIIIVALIFFAFYALTLILNKKDNKELTKNAEIQYDKILIGNIFNQPEDSYYVLVKEQCDNNDTLYETYIELYKSEKDSLNLYYADLSNPLNSKFVSEASKITISSIDDLRLKEVTLLKITKGKIVNSYEGSEKVKTELAKLAKVE